MKITFTLEVDIDEEVWCTNEEERIWFEKEVLATDGRLSLFSQEIGDTIGTITKVTNVNYGSGNN